MKIKLSNGKEFALNVLTRSIRNKDAILLEIRDDRLLSQVAADFEGLESFEEIDENRKANVGTTHTGYKRLTAISNPVEGVVRMTLEGVEA